MKQDLISRLLLYIGIACLAAYGYFTVQAHWQQSALEEELYHPLPPSKAVQSCPAPRRHLKEGDLFGRLEIPRLNLSVMVMEGDGDRILRLGAGHVPGTVMAIAAHRDTFFRPLKDIQVSDTIRVTTPDGTTEYHVVSTKIVSPKDVSVLDDDGDNTLTLVTCYPFYYIGPAPKRFIVRAQKN
jgi:sortase A